jgi:hypothetical protein
MARQIFIVAPLPKRAAAWLCGAAALIVAVAAPAAASAQMLDDGSGRILKAMSDYVGSQKNISFSYDSGIEVVTNQLQKIQFASSGTVLMSRPGSIRATRTGGYADVELVSNGKMVTLYGKNIQAFGQTEAPDTLEKLVDQLRDDLNLALPGADLLSRTSFDDLTADTIEGKHIGLGVVDGVECEHLAFRTPDTDWQIWIATSGPPIPHKYVIANKAVTGAPEYTLTIRNWKTDPQIAGDAFTFKEPGQAKKTALRDMRDLDEVPAGTYAPKQTTGAGK